MYHRLEKSGTFWICCYRCLGWVHELCAGIEKMNWISTFASIALDKQSDLSCDYKLFSLHRDITSCYFVLKILWLICTYLWISYFLYKKKKTYICSVHVSVISSLRFIAVLFIFYVLQFLRTVTFFISKY